MTTTIFARNYRGFQDLSITLDKTIFLVGDNSSGKSSILHLLNFVLSSDLDGQPILNDNLAIARHDFFSPYFNFADVTIGYFYEGEKINTARVITFKNFNNVPTVTRVTYASDGIIITLKHQGTKLFARIDTGDSKLDISSLRKIHDLNSGFKSLKEDAPDDQTNSPSNAFYAVSVLNPKLRESVKLRRAIFSSPLPGAAHIAPIRGEPAKFYNFERKYKSSGAHFATMLQDMPREEIERLKQLFAKFGNDSGLFEELEVQKISRKMADSPLLVLVKRNQKSFFLNQVGVGVSQVVPVLVECIFCLPGDGKQKITMLLQQPELHLHPVAQAAVGEFLFEMAVLGLPLVIETHSDFLIDRYRTRIRDGKDLSKFCGAKILYCQNEKGIIGNTVTSIDVGDDGKLIDPPDRYSDFFLNELLRTMF